MGIFIGKLLLYIVCGGISLVYILFIMLDVGINNENLFNDFMYMGCWYLWIVGQVYNDFLDVFMWVVFVWWFDVLIQFEDFVQVNVMFLL